MVRNLYPIQAPALLDIFPFSTKLYVHTQIKPGRCQDISKAGETQSLVGRHLLTLYLV